MQSVIVLLELPLTSDLHPLAGEFGFRFVALPRLDALEAFAREQDVCAVLFEPRQIAPHWREALGAVRNAAPHALLVVCMRFADGPPWEDLAAAGAFHALWVPFDRSEVRQSLGFIQQARLRRGVARAHLQSQAGAA